ncbi:hypothetical protein SSX86_012486 [Deinandra increscens subsp. villosa]|uniref:Protein kinase domain-containing protein n=1 Tax=Deinandra increscens subsp. villosa TaxID=3103831 RepID=A0AAP0D8I1_9ASTR
MDSTLARKIGHLQIPLEDVLVATDNFADENIISVGDFGPAYKGRLLRSGNSIKIAAKRLDPKFRHGYVHFLNEVSILSELNHENVISIIGFCDEKGEKIIITPSMANGSLQGDLDNPDLTWKQRLKISIGVARALGYLRHDEGRSYGVIHRNINSSTILLDENWEPKLSGFGISIKQSVNRDDRVILSEPIGALGYMDPEIKKRKGVTHKSDIYAFGVVLFEILCGRKAFIFIEKEEEANRFLAPLAKLHYENGTLEDIIHPNLRNQMNPQSLLKYSELAYSCLEEDPIHRPDVNYIISLLERTLNRQLGLKKLEKKNLEHLKISLDDILLASNKFSAHTYGSFDSGIVWYIGERDHFDKEKPSSKERENKDELPKRHNSVFIKRFLPTYEKQEEFFFTEIEILTSINHQNIVIPIGFCVEGSEMIIVFENPSNGYLVDYLTRKKEIRILTWERRLKICIDVAHALNYLHYEMEDKKVIIHTDIHSGKFVLDEKWGPKIDDFHTAVFMPSNQEDDALYLNKVVGTKYYRDPEHEKTGMLYRESDIYSFGVVLFEILCGRLAYDPIYLEESDQGLAHVARRSFGTGTLEKMIDPLIKGKINKDSFHSFIEIAYQCVSETQDQRPTIKVVVKELKKALLFQVSQEKQVQQRDKNPVGDQLQKTNHEISRNNFDLMVPLDVIKSVTHNFSDTYRFEVDADGCMWYRVELNHFHKENHLSVEGKNKGKHPKRHNNTVVIKRYPSRHRIFKEENFWTEIEMLTGVQHQNIAILLGFCAEASELILVIDNFSNGFLRSYLGEVNKMRIFTWEKRLKICIDIAHALNYLHYEMEDQKKIINRDICSENIGLDENWGAKIVNFWLSVFLPPKQEDEALYHNLRLGRTLYRDPEYELTKKLKRESDVYSFGVVLFEILCGRLASDPIYNKEGDGGLAVVARQSLHSRTLEKMIDPIIKEGTNENNFVLKRGPNKDSLNTFIEIAIQCVAETQDQRPSMKVVVRELEKALLSQQNNKENPSISLEDINQATQNFHNDNCVGGGGFGKVYTGKLQDGDGFKTIVAKRLNTRYGQGEQQFLTELQILLEYKHENIIGLVGYCNEKDEKIIVYEYASKGSLDRYLNDVSLTWVKRLNICIDVASALAFLHGGLKKTSKVLFEILCGRSMFAIQKQEGYSLPDFIKKKFEEGKDDEVVVFEQIREEIVPKSLTTFQEIAYQCLHHEREKRPTTKKVLIQLKKALEFQNMASTIAKFAHLQIPLEDVVKATNSFHHDNIIGQGDFGRAYKGRLLRSGRLMNIAARRFDCKHRDGDLKFLREISVLSHLSHPNLLSDYWIL